jgi:hypothetical protein
MFGLIPVFYVDLESTLTVGSDSISADLVSPVRIDEESFVLLVDCNASPNLNVLAEVSYLGFDQEENSGYVYRYFYRIADMCLPSSSNNSLICPASEDRIASGYNLIRG